MQCATFSQPMRVHGSPSSSGPSHCSILHPGRQGRKERGNLVGEQRLQRVEEGVNGPLGQLGQLVQDTQAHFLRPSGSTPARRQLENPHRNERAGAARSMPAGYHRDAKTFALHQSMGRAQETARRRFGPRQPHGDVVVFLKALRAAIGAKGATGCHRAAQRRFWPTLPCSKQQSSLGCIGIR